MSLLPITILTLWFLAALTIGHFQLLTQIPPPAIQGILLSLTAILLLLFFFQSRFRRWVFSLNIKILILYHLVRFVGIYFLILYAHGELPYDFAVKGGWGDTFVAAFALPAALMPLQKKAGRIFVQGWNLMGFADIVFVVITAARLTLQNPGSMRALTVLPLALLPTLIVPLIIATHVFIWVRLKD